MENSILLDTLKQYLQNDISFCLLTDEIFAKRVYSELTNLQEIGLYPLRFTYDDWKLINTLRSCDNSPFERLSDSVDVLLCRSNSKTKCSRSLQSYLLSYNHQQKFKLSMWVLS